MTGFLRMNVVELKMCVNRYILVALHTKYQEGEYCGMDVKEMLKKVDHTKLQAFCTWEEIVTLCEEAIQYETASVCIPPAYVERVHEKYGDRINICTVIGFPLGYQVTAAKVAEVQEALRQGCGEIDMVINISDVKTVFIIR